MKDYPSFWRTRAKMFNENETVAPDPDEPTGGQIAVVFLIVAVILGGIFSL